MLDSVIMERIAREGYHEANCLKGKSGGTLLHRGMMEKLKERIFLRQIATQGSHEVNCYKGNHPEN